ncbi:MAG: hypothetical protein ABIH00_04440, partial [Armatimonadota bacterium]
KKDGPKKTEIPLTNELKNKLIPILEKKLLPNDNTCKAFTKDFKNAITTDGTPAASVETETEETDKPAETSNANGKKPDVQIADIPIYYKGNKEALGKAGISFKDIRSEESQQNVLEIIPNKHAQNNFDISLATITDKESETSGSFSQTDTTGNRLLLDTKTQKIEVVKEGDAIKIYSYNNDENAPLNVLKFEPRKLDKVPILCKGDQDVIQGLGLQFKKASNGEYLITSNYEENAINPRHIKIESQAFNEMDIDKLRTLQPFTRISLQSKITTTDSDKIIIVGDKQRAKSDAYICVYNKDASVDVIKVTKVDLSR